MQFPIWVLFLVLAITSFCDCLKKYKKVEEDTDSNNFKCTELKDTVDPGVLLHVPCTLIRLTEHLKKCSFNSFFEAFLTIRCSEKCASGSLKKKLDRFTEHFKKKDDKIELVIQKYKKQAKKLFTIMEKSPANLTVNVNKDFDCMTFGYALKHYFESFQSNHSIRELFSLSDESMQIDEKLVEKQIERFRCVPEVKSDISFYHYLKYVSDSLRAMASSESTPKSELNIVNVAHLFAPYVELDDKFSRILPGHSYLLYILQNHDKLFGNNTPCDNEKDLGDKKTENKKSKKWKFG